MAITVTAYGEKYIVEVDGVATVHSKTEVELVKAGLEDNLVSLLATYNAEKAEIEALIAEKTEIISQMT